MCGATASAQQLLDRVLARIGTEAITQTDVQALAEFGLVEGKPAGDPDAVRQVIERQLVLRELARFPLSEPQAGSVDRQLDLMKARVGSRLDEVMRATGLDEARLRGLARDTLRIRTYYEQRFGLASQVSEDEARKYFEEHRDQFTRGDMPPAFEEVAAAARRRASEARHQGAVAEWLQDLRSRSEVALVSP
jgi:hypothetical protein